MKTKILIASLIVLLLIGIGFADVLITKEIDLTKEQSDALDSKGIVEPTYKTTQDDEYVYLTLKENKADGSNAIDRMFRIEKITKELAREYTYEEWMDDSVIKEYVYRLKTETEIQEQIDFIIKNNLETTAGGFIKRDKSKDKTNKEEGKIKIK